LNTNSKQAGAQKLLLLSFKKEKKQKKEVGGTLLRFPPCPLSALKLHKFSFNNLFCLTSRTDLFA